MMFDFIIGNPPYQESISDNNRDTTLYNLFMDESYKLADCVLLITKAGFLFNVGNTPEKWNKKMLNDKHFHVLFYEEDAKKIFTTSIIKGGIAITIYNSKIDYGAIKIFTKYQQLNNIITKLLENCHQVIRFDSLVSSQGLYKFSENALTEHPEILNKTGKGTGRKITSKLLEQLPTIFLDDASESITRTNYIRLLGVVNGMRKYKFIRRDYVQYNPYIDKYNIAFPQANGEGIFGQTLTQSVVLKPQDGTTDTFLNIGKYSTESEADNVIKYIKTKFFRTLLGVYKTTHNTPKTVWSLIPIEDFTINSDIDWSVSISEIDQQLYKKYSLTEEEINFIETNVKEMK